MNKKSKTFFVLILGIIFVGVSISAEEKNKNLIKNPSFEDTTVEGNSLKGWRVANWGKGHGKDEIQLIAVPDRVEGNVAAQIKYYGESKSVLIAQTVVIKGAKKLRLKFWGKIAREQYIHASFLTRDKNRKRLQYVWSRSQKEGGKLVGNGKWQEFKMDFITSPKTVSVDIYLRATAGDALFDKVSLGER